MSETLDSLTADVHIPLALAYFCINCEEIHKTSGVSGCPACGSDVVMPLTAWLGQSK